MQTQRFEVPVPGEVDGGVLVGVRCGSGDPVLVLHGGPGLSASMCDGLVAELAEGYDVAMHQQRGLRPSTACGPYDVPTQVRDVVAVLDGLGWQQAVVVGFSYGGHLLLHLLADHPERVRAAVLVDPLGGVGDGGEAEFDAAMSARTPDDARARARELDDRGLAGEGSDDDATEGFRLFWPAYFADPSAAPPVPEGIRVSVPASSTTWASGEELLPGLAPRLAGCAVPTVFVHGGASPMPVSASTGTAAAMGEHARVVVVPGAGHLVWHEAPGAVRAAVDSLVRDAP